MRHPTTIALALLLVPSLAWAQGGDHDKMIHNALMAAPPDVAQDAKVMTFTGEVLREGGNGWTCFPDDPAAPNNSPMCLDATWVEVIDAWASHREPQYSGTGVAYMLQGDSPLSNTDPFAKGPTEDNQWLTEGTPHLMIAVSDQAMLENMSSDPHTGGPWVMWKGTPYAHIMIPTVPRTK